MWNIYGDSGGVLWLPLSILQDMDLSGGQPQTSQHSQELPLPQESTEGAKVTQCAGSDSGEGEGGRVVDGGGGGGGCEEGTGRCAGGEGRGGEGMSESSSAGGGLMDSEVAHISAILAKLPSADTTPADGSSAVLLETEIDQ